MSRLETRLNKEALRNPSKKAQSGTETIIILSAMLFILLLVFILQEKTAASVTGSIQEGKIRSSLKSISDAASLVYKQGYGAKTTITINLPTGIASTVINGTNIGFILDSGRTIYSNLAFQAIGSLPITSGDNQVIVSSEGDYVLLFGALFSIRPSVIIESMDKDSISMKSINITNLLNETLHINLSSIASGISLGIGVSSVDLSPYESNVIGINIISEDEYGKFLSHLSIDSRSDSGESQSFMLPIYVDVVQPGIATLNGTIEGSIGFIPSSYDFGTVVPGSEHSKTLIIYSGFNATKIVNISFSPAYSGWFSLSDFSQPQLTEQSINLSARDYQEITVYLKTWINTTEGNYSEYLIAEYDVGSGTASLSLNRAHDIGPPVVNFTNASSFSAYMGSTICISAKAYDDTGVMSVFMNYTDNNGAKYSVEMNDTNISCSGNESDNLYGVVINLTYPGNYTIWNISAYDFNENIGINNTPIYIKSRKKIYGDFPFNGTVLSELNESGCIWSPTSGSNQYASNASYVDSLYVANREDAYICVPWVPDYTIFKWPSLDVPSDVNITNVQLTIRHAERYTWTIKTDPNDESLNYLHMILCWNGTNYTNIEPYAITSSETDWQNYTNYDISNCINDSNKANNARIKITYDEGPTSLADSIIKFDYVQLLVDTSDSYIIDLGHSPGDRISPTEFNSALNSTGNTFTVAGSSDGWDWSDGVYGDSGIYNSSFVKHYDPSISSDGYSSGKIEIRIGGNNSGTSLGIASGAWGIDFNITPEIYEVIENGNGVAYLSFNYIVDDLYNTTIGLGNGVTGMGGAWVKARFGNSDSMYYLGKDLDNTASASLHYADSTRELWDAITPSSPSWGSNSTGRCIAQRTFSQNVTEYIDGAGIYYIDLGGKVSWESGVKANNETIGFYFDNIRLIVKY